MKDLNRMIDYSKDKRRDFGQETNKEEDKGRQGNTNNTPAQFLTGTPIVGDGNIAHPETPGPRAQRRAEPDFTSRRQTGQPTRTGSEWEQLGTGPDGPQLPGQEVQHGLLQYPLASS